MTSTARSRSGRSLLLMPFVAAVALLLWAAAVVAEEPPLTDEDIVRLFVSGSGTQELCALIRASAVEFDLSPEMLEELRFAGLPDEVIRAMVERQAQQDETESPERAAEADDAGTVQPRLRVVINPKKERTGEPQALRMLDAIEPRVVEAWQLGPQVRQFTGLALFLTCRTADHVPDHWRSRSPLGRDFRSARRHRVLLFLPEASRVPAGKFREQMSKLALLPGERESLPDLGVLELEIPLSMEVELAPGTVHDLTLGIAVQAGGRYYVAVSDDLDAVVVAETGAEIEAEVTPGSGMRPSSPRVRFVPR